MADWGDGQVARCLARMEDVNGSLIENAYFYHNSTGADIAEATALTAIEAELSAMYAEVEGMIADSCTPVDIKVDNVAFVSGKLTVTSAIGTIAWTTWSGGTSTSDGLPQGVAAVVNFPSGTVGVQGRKYIGPLTEGQQADGNLASSALTFLANFASEYLDGMSVSATTVYPVLMSSKVGSYVAGLSAVVKGVLGYQRRRKAGVGK